MKLAFKSLDKNNDGVSHCHFLCKVAFMLPTSKTEAFQMTVVCVSVYFVNVIESSCFYSFF